MVTLYMFQIGKGLLRAIHGNKKCIADIIPVDIAVNMFIAASWHTAIERYGYHVALLYSILNQYYCKVYITFIQRIKFNSL